MKSSHKKIIVFLVVVVVVWLGKMGGFLRTILPNGGVDQHTIIDKTVVAQVALQCPLFDQTDIDVLIQQSDKEEIYFSGCDGFL